MRGHELTVAQTGNYAAGLLMLTFGLLFLMPCYLSLVTRKGPAAIPVPD
jgi:hypothetical protein